jgi:large subunit ribosomal protein L25
MADATLSAERRTAAGKGPAGRLRREGLVPAVVYGLGEDNVPVTVSLRELSHVLSGPSGVNTIITLQLDGKDQLALARQIQRNPLKGTLVHVDFIRIRADQEIQADVPVHLVGDAEGVSRGGVLEQLVHAVTVEAKPGDVPPSLEIEISALEIGDSVRVSDLVVPAGVTIRNDPGDLVAHISAPRVAEEEVAEAAAEEGEAAAGAPAEGETASSESE